MRASEEACQSFAHNDRYTNRESIFELTYGEYDRKDCVS